MPSRNFGVLANVQTIAQQNYVIQAKVTKQQNTAVNMNNKIVHP